MNETDYTLEDAEDAVCSSMSADDRQTRYEHDEGCKGLRFILDALEAAQGNEVSLATAAADARHERNVATDTLAAAERELEGVRKVEAWASKGLRKVTLCDGEWAALEWTSAADDYMARHVADSLAELGHLLPEVPDAK